MEEFSADPGPPGLRGAGGDTTEGGLARLLGWPRMDVEQRRRRLYFALCALAGGATMALFGVVAIADGRVAEGVGITAVASMLLAFLVVLRLIRSAHVVYRGAAVLLLALFAFQLLWGGDEGPYYLYFYAFPIAAFFMFDRMEGTWWVVGSAGMASALFLVSGLAGTNAYGSETWVPFMVNYGILAVLSYGLESSRQRYYGALLREKQELEQAHGRIRVLSGLLPVCASCKKVRDDKGYWNQIESYIKENTDAEISHGICPECARELYSEFLDEDGDLSESACP